ncbi:MAG: hypothetical protein ABIK79_08375 [Chloroflexota bacterium]|nr:hypothetical protein [Anaerolineae bacterium]
MMITSRARLAWVGCSALLIASYLLWGCGTTPTDLAPSYEDDVPPVDLARHYSPIIHQGAASDQDFITAVDFDGDWIGSNNWENQPTGDLSAYVYYSVAETETHWFLFYALFHPRDYTSRPCNQSGGCHENDMESIQMVVAKDDTPYGRLQAMETLAHGDIYLYTMDPYTPDRPVRGGYLKVKGKGKIRLQGSHPIVTVETYGHGIRGSRQVLLPHVAIYHEGNQAEAPESLGDKNVSYQLVSIYDTLWAHRDEIGPGYIFDQPFDYREHILPAVFDGENYGVDKANTPWGYNQATGSKLIRGDWFLDPAKALSYHAEFEGDFSRTYLHNQYLVDLELDIFYEHFAEALDTTRRIFRMARVSYEVGHGYGCD